MSIILKQVLRVNQAGFEKMVLSLNRTNLKYEAKVFSQFKEFYFRCEMEHFCAYLLLYLLSMVMIAVTSADALLFNLSLTCLIVALYAATSLLFDFVFVERAVYSLNSLCHSLDVVSDEGRRALLDKLPQIYAKFRRAVSWYYRAVFVAICVISVIVSSHIFQHYEALPLIISLFVSIYIASIMTIELNYSNPTDIRRLEAWDSQMDEAKQTINDQFALYLRGFENELETRGEAVQEYVPNDQGIWPKLYTSSRVGPERAIEALLGSKRIVAVKHLHSPHQYALDCSKIPIFAANWVPYVEILISRASFIIVNAVTIGPGLRQEVELITKHGRQNEALVILSSSQTNAHKIGISSFRNVVVLEHIYAIVADDSVALTELVEEYKSKISKFIPPHLLA